MNTRPIRVATIYHNDDNPEDKSHRRIRLELVKTNGKYISGYIWRTVDGEEAGNMGTHKTVYEAEAAALEAWGGSEWDLRATWKS